MFVHSYIVSHKEPDVSEDNLSNKLGSFFTCIILAVYSGTNHLEKSVSIVF